MRKAILNPADRRRLSALLSLLNLKSRRTIIPGTRVRKTNPITCLATGILRNTVMSTASCKIMTNIRKLNGL
jgi:hypothetical protein